MSNNWNQRHAANIRRGIEYAERCNAEGRIAGAKRVLDEVGRELATFNPFRFRGETWDKLRRSYKEVQEVLRVKLATPCDCFYCGFDAEQKQIVTELTRQKAADFDGIEGSNQGNNFTGACAEVIFGVRFHLPINLESGPDGGKDFCLPCGQMPSRILTIDVKGTTYNEFRLPEHFIRKPDHIYVLIQVVEREHAFFRGFAFGTDEFEEHRKNPFEDETLYKPRSVRALSELEQLITAAQFRKGGSLV